GPARGLAACLGPGQLGGAAGGRRTGRPYPLRSLCRPAPDRTDRSRSTIRGITRRERIPTVDAMQRLLRTAFAYMLLGVVSGLFYREYTKATDTVGIDSQLSILHTHLLALGMLVFLVVLALAALFSLTGRRSFSVFYWTYNIGLLVTVVMQAVRGMLTLDGQDPAATSAAIPGIAGLGHILLTIGLVALFVALRAAIADRAAPQEGTALRDRPVTA